MASAPWMMVIVGVENEQHSDSNLDLPIFGSSIYHESSALDHVATLMLDWPADDGEIKYMFDIGQYVSAEDVSRHLGHCVRDNLVRLVKRVGFKGSQTGKKQESYRLPQGTVKKDNHDWYCFECHGGGDVICCTGCHRVYHLSCVATDLSEEDVKKTFVCSVCKMCKESDKFKISRRELNHLLGFTCSRLKERLPVVITERQVPSKQLYISDRAASSAAALQRRSDPSLGIKWVTDDEDSWRVNYLIYQPMDLHTMDCKAQNKKYRTLEEFQADAQTIVHNVVIYHGEQQFPNCGT
uniref:Bromo domain-containing protein n=1 Tax=Timema poppense TaxID=170557 RepID=A0A7R9CIE8_TIMPO|nr:unnamed protein product [Timema poppensis]